jgi:hypothetical protein
MKLSSRSLIALGALLVACGSADSSFLTGSSSPGVVAVGGMAGASGGTSGGGPGTGGGMFTTGGSTATGAGGAGNGVGGAASAGGARFATGGVSQGSAGSGPGGTLGSGGARPAEGGAGSTLASLPTGGIVSTACATCTKNHCPNELTACDADPACRAAETCMTTCSLADCTSCVLGAPVSFKQLFSDCIAASCPNVCPVITTG